MDGNVSMVPVTDNETDLIRRAQADDANAFSFLAERYALWANCDRRRRIYTLAEAELKGDQAQRFLLSQFVRHPWWLTDEHFRQALMHGVEHPMLEPTRTAA